MISEWNLSMVKYCANAVEENRMRINPRAVNRTNLSDTLYCPIGVLILSSVFCFLFSAYCILLKANLHRFSLRFGRLQLEELLLLKAKLRGNQVRRKGFDGDVIVPDHGIIISPGRLDIILQLLELGLKL